MNFFKVAFQSITNYFTKTTKITQTKAKHPSIISRIAGAFKKPKAEPPSPSIEVNLSKGEKRRASMLSAEAEATKRALEVIQHAMENPDDATARQAKQKAIEYLNRNKELEGKGRLQDANRETIAQRWIESDLSSVEGQERRKARQLEQFNRNFGLNLSEATWDTMDKIMETPAFQKQKELLGFQYETLFEAVGDAVEKNIDPVRIEQLLELYTNVGADDYELFADLTELSDIAFTNFTEDVMAKIGEQTGLEQYEINWSLRWIANDYVQKYYEKEAYSEW